MRCVLIAVGRGERVCGCVEITHIGVHVEAFVVEHGGGELHHLRQGEYVFQFVCDLFGNELHKVGH